MATPPRLVHIIAWRDSVLALDDLGRLWIGVPKITDLVFIPHFEWYRIAGPVE